MFLEMFLLILEKVTLFCAFVLLAYFLVANELEIKKLNKQLDMEELEDLDELEEENNVVYIDDFR